MKLINKLFDWFFVKEKVEIKEQSVYISCSELFIKH